MNDLAKLTLQNLFNQRITSNKLVFLKKGGEPVNAHHIYRQFKQAQKVASIANTIRFHDIRHTFASQFVINGGSVCMTFKRY